MKRALAVVSLLLPTLGTVAPAGGAIVLGGGPAYSDCWAAFDVPASADGYSKIVCTDGDPACDADGQRDGVCTFGMRLCVHLNHVDDCKPRRMSLLRVATAGYPRPLPFTLSLPELPASHEACGGRFSVRVPLKRSRTNLKRGRAQMRLTAVTNQERRDRDRLRLYCMPGTPRCFVNPSGGPAELDIVAASSGSDVDVGSAGATHDLPLPAGLRLQLCVTDCDGTTDPLCQVTGGYFDQRLMTPLPLVAGGVPMCVTGGLGSRGVSGTADVQSGAVAVSADMTASVYVTDAGQLCPRCVGGAGPGQAGTCDGGANVGAACVIERVAYSVSGAVGDPVYTLSRTCVPAGDPVASIPIGLPLTTDVATVSPAACAAPDPGCGTCTEGICTGEACVSTTPELGCVDARGGLAQACCSADPTRPCFPEPTVRQGIAVPPTPAWPDPQYPKTAPGAALAAALCAPATGVSSVDAAVGLPGPATVLLPFTAEWVQ